MTPTRVQLQSLEDRLVPSVSLVADINRDLSYANLIQPLVTVNDTVLFQSTAYEGGMVWRSDGTPAGTGPAEPGVQLGNYGDGVEFAGAHYFSRFDAAHGEELWRTDGRAQGTRLILDAFAGPLSGYPSLFTVAGNTLYFVANRNQLWRTDGTTAGTIWFQTLGINSTQYEFPENGIFGLAAAGNQIYIQVRGLTGTELWISNGTTLGTRRVFNAPYSSGSSLGELLGAAGDSFFFSAGSFTERPRLWATDGTAAGTWQVRNDVGMRGDLHVQGSAATFGGRLYFVGSADGTSDWELWVSDGTAVGTTLVKDINPTDSSLPQDLVVQGSYLYFTADDGTTGRELWRTDGTADGTIRLADIYTGPESSDVESLTPTTGALYFTATNPTTGEEVWMTDGTPEGTVQVADLEPGPGSSFPTWLVSTGERVFWVGNTRADGSSLWVAGPGTGATLLSAVPARTDNSTFGSGVTIGGVRYSVANDGESGHEIWRTDGTW